MVIKQRKRDGWTTPKSTIDAPKKDIVKEALEPQPYWDDWNEHRDGMRDWQSDKSKLRTDNMLKEKGEYWIDECNEFKKNNDKLKKKLDVRKAMKDIEEAKK